MSEKASERATRVGRAKAGFNQIVVDYPPTTAAIEALEELRVANALRCEGEPRSGVLLNAPTGAGKTLSLKLAAAHAAANAAEGCTPILLVQMPTAGTTDSIPSAILAALGHARPDLGKPEARWLRATADMRRRGVEVLAFDEFNRAGRRPTMSRPIATIIREKVMDAGVAAVAFVGTAEASVVLNQCPELLERLDEEIDLSPLEWHEAEDREIFIQFVRDVDEAIVARNLLDEPSRLDDVQLAEKLCEGSAGRLRPLMGIIRAAMATSLRRGGVSITVDDLRDAVDGYSLRFGIVERNPFG